MEGGLISDGALAQDINQISSFWQIREVFIPIQWFSINIAVSFRERMLDDTQIS